MKRYLRTWRIAGLAALASLVVALFAAAPAGAGTSTNSACKGTAPYQKCENLTVTVTPKLNRKVKISVTVNNTPTVTVKLFKHTATGYKFLRNVFRGNVASGTKKLSIRTPTVGKYEIKTKANFQGLVAATTNKFKSKL